MPERIDTAQIRDLYLPNRDIPAHWDGPRTIRDLCDALDATRNDIRVLDDALDVARAERDGMANRRNRSEVAAMVRAEAAEAELEEANEQGKAMRDRAYTAEAALSDAQEAARLYAEKSMAAGACIAAARALIVQSSHVNAPSLADILRALTGGTP